MFMRSERRKSSRAWKDGVLADFAKDILEDGSRQDARGCAGDLRGGRGGGQGTGEGGKVSGIAFDARHSGLEIRRRRRATEESLRQTIKQLRRYLVSKADACILASNHPRHLHSCVKPSNDCVGSLCCLDTCTMKGFRVYGLGLGLRVGGLPV
jgi:hypothetical protein